MKTIRQQLQESSSKESAIHIRNQLLSRPELLDELVQVYLEGPVRLTQRAAGVVCLCAERNLSQVKPFLRPMINQLKEQGISDAAKRNTVRILQVTGIPEELEDDIMVLCFGYLESPGEAVAVKAFAMSLLHRLSAKYPEIQNELCLLIEDQLPFQKPAFVSRGIKILAQLRK